MDKFTSPLYRIEGFSLGNVYGKQAGNGNGTGEFIAFSLCFFICLTYCPLVKTNCGITKGYGRKSLITFCCLLILEIN
jgi:hypothetical protein